MVTFVVDEKVSMERKILFVCYGAGHVNMLIPIIRKAMADPGLAVVVLGLTTAGPVLEKSDIPYLGFRDLVDDQDERALNFGENLAASVPPGGGVPREESVAYLGLSFDDLVNRHGLEEAKALYEKKGRQAFLPLSVMHRLFDKVQPDLLVSTNSPRAERAAFMVARDRNVPSVCIVGLFAKHEIEWIGEPNFGTRVCVLSDGVKKFIESAGRFKHEVIVTGNPALDRLSRGSLSEEAKTFRAQRHWQDKKLILWASQPEPEKHPFTGVSADPLLPRQVDQELIRIAAQNPDWQIIIRYHPGESIDPSDWPSGAYISTRDEDLAVLLKSVDVVITMTSTVGLEGLLLEKPLITVDKSVFREDAPYSEMGLSMGVNNIGDLGSALDRVLSQGWKPKETLPKVGAAGDRIYSVMKEILYEVH